MLFQEISFTRCLNVCKVKPSTMNSVLLEPGIWDRIQEHLLSLSMQPARDIEELFETELCLSLLRKLYLSTVFFFLVNSDTLLFYT